MDAKVIVWDKKWKNMAKKVKKRFHFFILGLQIWEYDILYVLFYLSRVKGLGSRVFNR